MTAEAASRSMELEATFREVQRRTVRWVLPGLIVAGLVLFIAFPKPEDTVWSIAMGTGCILVAIAAYALDRWRFAAAAVALAVGSLAVALALVFWGGYAPAVVLLSVPTGLTALLLGPAVGVGEAMLLTLALLVPVPGLPDGAGALRSVALTGLWGTLALVALTLRPLLTAASVAREGYEHNRVLLEEARENRLQLAQALEDYAAANAQLARLNTLAQGLRQVADEARRVKEEFVANVSHELRTPLNMIVGYSEMILNAPQTYGGRLPPALLADLKIIHRNCQHLSSLVDDVLDLSQIEMGRAALTKERVAFGEIVEAAVTAVQPLFQSKGLSLRVELADDLPPVLCDRTRIREVLLNLLSNAGRFTEAGGVVVRAERHDQMLTVSVTDTGPGISEEGRARIFQPFEQLDSSIRRRYGGSGLGLAISRAFVEMHGGTMALESTVGEGTTISFTLPLVPPEPLAGGPARWIRPDWEYRRPARPRLAETPAPRPRFVVLETGETLQRLLRRYWDEVEVVSTTTLEAALEALAGGTAHALLINAESVIETLHALRAVSLPAVGAPVFVCTVPGIAEAATALGASDYLVKPISREALLAALARLAPEGRRVLVVDDEPDALRLFWRILASAPEGYQVTTAINGQEALDLMSEAPPDALLLDLVMPEMDGFRLLQAKQADPALREIPAVVLSALDPAGQPIVSESLIVMQGQGLSVAQLFASIESVCRVMVPSAWPQARREEEGQGSQE